VRAAISAFPGAGLRVPRVGIGTSGFRRDDAREVMAIVSAAIDRGLTLFDTADVYHDGESETILGQALAGRRDSCIIATKCGHGRQLPGANRRTLRLAVEASLGRLRTDRIDLFQLHAPDPVTPLEETVSTLQDLVREGKLLYYGFCNFEPWRLIDAYHLACRGGGALPVVLQAPVSAVELASHKAVLPVLQRCGIGMAAASPLARGLLGRAYDLDAPPPRDHPLMGRKGHFIWTELNREVARRLRNVAARRALNPARVALDLVLCQSMIVTALARPRNISDLDDYAEAGKDAIPADEIRYILYGDPIPND
jgi:aryl-alcohol dehydrogenase-like predicted oxidoreductase